MENMKETVTYCLGDLDELYDRECRTIYINNIIDESTSESITYMIMKYNRDDKGKSIEDRKPIFIYINSLGGSVSDGFAIIDAVVASKTPVYTVNIGTSYSMGFLIFLSGTKRYATINSTFLCHEGSSSVYDTMSKAKDRMEFENNQMEKHIMDYVLSRTHISESLYQEQYRKEWYMYPEEAKKLGVVTDIVGIDCDIDDII
ncbi:MAG: ATP-dependent Clp protease proteolytic subunit [Bacteroidaceae bacterium]|nr:ATP-dependent Clp protease proteolytic subunit [Bacteroidaceae bacterium]